MTSPYNTLPRSAASSRSQSGATTPARTHTRVVSNPSGLYHALRRRLSTITLSSPPTVSIVDDSPAGTVRRRNYADEEDRARREGNAESWGAIGAYVNGIRASSSPKRRVVDSVTDSSYSGAGTSRTSQRGQSEEASSSHQPLSTSNLTEEPGSYAELDRRIEDRTENPPGYGSHPALVLGTRPRSSSTASSSAASSDDEAPPARRRSSTVQKARPHEQSWLRRVWPPSPVQKGVIKCVLAYLIAEAFTFVPILSELVGAPFDQEGPVKNAHVIATVAVYFNPAKTIGSMIEADLFAVLGLLFSIFLCCGSMAMTVFLDTHGGHYIIAHTIVLVFWLGGGFSLLAYVKVKANMPTVTTACSLISLISSVIITKEGAFHIGEFQSRAILQVTIIVFIGTCISNLVCFALWPGSATSKLQGDLNKTLNSFSTLLEMLTKTFLLDDDITTRPESLKKAIDAHQASFTTLKTSLSQARYETFLDSRLRATSRSYDDAVHAMTRLAQGLTGMRAGCQLQYELMKADLEGVKEDQRLDSERDVLQRFRKRVGPSLQRLTKTSRTTLALLRTTFVNTHAGAAAFEASHNSDDVESALSSDALMSVKLELEQSLLLFKREHSQAVKVIYQRRPEETLFGSLPGDSAENGAEDKPKPFPSTAFEEEDDGPNDNLFRIFYFCFNFEEWVSELGQLVDTFIDIRAAEEEIAHRDIGIHAQWGALSFAVRAYHNVFDSGRSHGRRGVSKRKTLSQRAKSIGQSIQGIIKSPATGHSPFPEIVDGALSSHQVPSSQLNLLGRFKRNFWHFLWHLRQPNIRFSIKTGFGVTVLASAAFIPSLRPLWLEWRGEWALISYMVVMAPTLGGTNFLAVGRLVGTAVGAIAAVGVYMLFPGDPIGLPICGAIFSIPCFYVIVTKPQYGPSSRFVLLTFNLTCLYAYNLREADTHVVAIAVHRSIAVGAGVIWGLFINLYIWPFEARRELRKGLSEFFINSAYLYERIVRTYSIPPAALAKVHDGMREVSETSPLLPNDAREHLDDAVEDFIAMEVYLQRSLIKLSGLLASTAHEPRLKGPFPITKYRTILNSCQTMLDLLTSMRTVTTQEAWYLIVGNVLLYFAILASVFTLKTPLPPFMPPAREARDRLVLKLRQLPVVKKRIVRGGSEGLLYLAYVLTMKDVISQLETLGSTLQSLFGIIGGAVDNGAFEALFVAQEEPGHDSGDETPMSGRSFR